MLVSDLDRSNQTNDVMRKQCESMQEEMQLIKENASKTVNNGNVVNHDDSHLVSQNNLELELSTKEREVQQLVEDVKRLQSSLIKINENTSSQINKLEEELQQKTNFVLDRQRELDNKNDYDEI